MELNDTFSNASAPSLLSEVFALTESNGRSTAERERAVKELHARLASSDFADRMTGIFFEAKRAALAQSK